MARRAFQVVNLTEILTHWYAGRPIAEIARSLGVDPKTVRKYTAPAEAAGLVPRGPVLSPETWAANAREWFPELVVPDLRRPTFAEIARFHERIKDDIEQCTASTVWQRLRDEEGLAVSLASFRRYLYEHLPEEVARNRVTVLKDDPPPGAESQVDYGYLGMWEDPARGKARKVWAFSMVLSASRHMFVRPVLTMDLAAWVESHVAAWEFFSGATCRTVVDNLKAGVLRPDLYDPLLNRTYAELAHHYGTLVDPARVRRPKDKPRIERPQPYIRDSFFRGRTFASIEEMQEAALVWCSEVAGRRSCRPLSGATPLTVFQAVEAEALVPLPGRPYEMAVWSTPKVHPDIHVKVGRTIYSVPWRYLGRRVDTRQTSRTVEIFVDGELVKTHARKEKGKQTDWNDYPPEKVAFFLRTPAWCRHRAKQMGPAAAAVVGELLAVNALYRLRAAQGVIALAERHGDKRVERACARALEVGDPSYKTIKGILAAGTEGAGREEPGPGAGAPAHLHGPARLFVVEGEEAS